MVATRTARMFSSPDLAARIDRAEGRLCAAIARACRDPRVIELGGGVAVLAERDAPSNKMIGVGFDGAVDESSLADVERCFAAAGARLQAEISTLAEPEVHRQLVVRGYAPSGFENVLGHSLHGNIEQPADGIAIELVAPSDLAALADVMAEGFANPDVGGVGGDVIPPSHEIRRWFDVTLQASGFRGYVARIEGEI